MDANHQWIQLNYIGLSSYSADRAGFKIATHKTRCRNFESSPVNKQVRDKVRAAKWLSSA
jgi:hypothetical protein